MGLMSYLIGKSRSVAPVSLPHVVLVLISPRTLIVPRDPMLPLEFEEALLLVEDLDDFLSYEALTEPPPYGVSTSTEAPIPTLDFSVLDLIDEIWALVAVDLK